LIIENGENEMYNITIKVSKIETEETDDKKWVAEIENLNYEPTDSSAMAFFGVKGKQYGQTGWEALMKIAENFKRREFLK